MEQESSRQSMPAADWDPVADTHGMDQLTVFDRMRERFGVAYSDLLQWSVFRHADVRHVLLHPEIFSSVVSRHVAVPNGMDPPSHTCYRKLINPYFDPEPIGRFGQICSELAARLIAGLPRDRPVEFISEYALPFAVRVQCAFMGWSEKPVDELIEWIRQHGEASRAGDRAAHARLGQQFQRLIEHKIALRANGEVVAHDVTTSLMRERVNGRPLSAKYLASIIRNWTVGEIGSIAASVGIIMEWLARHPELQAQLRAKPGLIPEAVDEIMRLHGPLPANRRVVLRDTELGGRWLRAGSRLVVHWPAANRDPRVFVAPHEFRWHRDHGKNLLYGAGIHVCPGAEMSRMEMRLALEAIFAAVPRFSFAPRMSPRFARYPIMGFEYLPLQL